MDLFPAERQLLTSKTGTRTLWYVGATMQLILQSRMMGNVVIIHCQGRIISGDEVGTLQLEVERLTQFTKKVVLQLAEVSYIDSGGLGALVRLLGVLRAQGGHLKLCQLSPFVLQVLQVTNLLGVFHTYASEEQAIEAFPERLGPLEEMSRTARTRIVCIDSSNDLLAYLNALLKRAGYEVFTTRHRSDARTLVAATRPRVVIYGPGMQTSDPVIGEFHQSVPNVQVLLLPSDFSTTEAGQMGTELVNRVRSVLMAQPSSG